MELEREKDRKINFKPGQYMEWTLAHGASDSRGVRRFFTIASSPTEKDLRIGVKFYPEPSSFKNYLLAMPVDEEIIATSRAGDFTLPKDDKQEIVLIAGGIGITPFRSMIKYLLDKKEKRLLNFIRGGCLSDSDTKEFTKDELAKKESVFFVVPADKCKK